MSEEVSCVYPSAPGYPPVAESLIGELPEAVATENKSEPSLMGISLRDLSIAGCLFSVFRALFIVFAGDIAFRLYYGYEVDDHLFLLAAIIVIAMAYLWLVFALLAWYGIIRQKPLLVYPLVVMQIASWTFELMTLVIRTKTLTYWEKGIPSAFPVLVADIFFVYILLRYSSFLKSSV
jgi:hypothetical protein